MLIITPNYTPENTLANNYTVTLFNVCVHAKVTFVKLVHVKLIDKVRTDGKVIMSLLYAGRLGICFNLNV